MQVWPAGPRGHRPHGAASPVPTGPARRERKRRGSMDEARTASGHSSWADDTAYVPLTGADRAIFAWEFARRKYGSPACAPSSVTALTDNKIGRASWWERVCP